MEHEASLPWSQEHATGLWSETDESSLHYYTIFLKDPFQYYPTIYGSQVISSLQHFQLKCYTHFSSPYSCYTYILSISISGFDRPNNTLQREQIIKFLIMYFLSCCYLFILAPLRSYHTLFVTTGENEQGNEHLERDRERIIIVTAHKS
jgi:hypothetical protein